MADSQFTDEGYDGGFGGLTNTSQNQSVNHANKVAAWNKAVASDPDPDVAKDGYGAIGSGDDWKVSQEGYAANVGGYVGGMQDMEAAGQAGMDSNNGQQAANTAAMQQSVANMGTTGPQNAQNASLLSRQAGARQQQVSALQPLQAQALGTAPSAAAGQTRMAMDSNAAGMAGSLGQAHGLAGLNGAQVSGAGMMGSGASAAGMTGASARAAEVNGGLSAYGAASGALRDNDITALKTGDQNALANTGLRDSWQLGNANLAAKQGALGLAQTSTDQNWYQTAMDPTYRQLSYDQQMNAINAGQSGSDSATAFAQQQANNATARQIASGVVGAVGTAVGGPVAGAAASAGTGMLSSAIGKYG